MDMELIKKAYAITIIAGMRTLDSVIPITMVPDVMEYIKVEEADRGTPPELSALIRPENHVDKYNEVIKEKEEVKKETKKK